MPRSLLLALLSCSFASAQSLDFEAALPVMYRADTLRMAFGQSVALSGEVAAATLPARVPSVGDEFFETYIYEFVGGTWEPRQRIQSDDLGFSIAMGGDLLLLGGPSFGSGPGEAAVYRREGSSFQVEALLTASDGVARDQFGLNVALWGDRAVIAAPEHDDGRGAVYVFERQTGGTWTEVAKLTIDEAGEDDRLGFELAIDGDVIAVSSIYHDADPGTGTPINGSGAVWVFERIEGTWTRTARLLPSDISALDQFGWGLGLDDGLLVAGSPNSGPGFFRGKAYVFERGSDRSWTETAELVASDAEDNAEFGAEIDVQAGVALVGSPGDEVQAVYRFEQVGGSWSEVSTLAYRDPEPGYGNVSFGLEIDMSHPRVLISDPYRTDIATQFDQRGGVYVFSGLPPVASEPGAESSGLALRAAPNPARGRTTLTLSLRTPETTRIDLLDVLGRHVRTIHHGPLAAGGHVLPLDTSSLAPGLYVVHAVSPTATASAAVTVVR